MSLIRLCSFRFSHVPALSQVWHVPGSHLQQLLTNRELLLPCTRLVQRGSQRCKVACITATHDSLPVAHFPVQWLWALWGWEFIMCLLYRGAHSSAAPSTPQLTLHFRRLSHARSELCAACLSLSRLYPSLSSTLIYKFGRTEELWA